MRTAPFRFFPLSLLFKSIVVVVAFSHGLALRAQSPAATSVQKAHLTFDAASVKTAIIPDGVTISGDSIDGPTWDVQKLKRTGGPGTNDPGRIHYPLVSLRQLLYLAWDGLYSGIKSPDWLDTRAVAVDATMPRETTKEQFREMLRNLIIERFSLRYHVETKQGAGGFYLVVPTGSPDLKADPTKIPVEVMVVDHVDRTPAEN
jgi:hypothetical protein